MTLGLSESSNGKPSGLPEDQWRDLCPVTDIKDLPEAFDKLDVPNFIQMDSKEINKNKGKWIDEWLNAL